MYCPKCGFEITGNYCSNCGNHIIKNKDYWLLGFRSKKVWKSIVSVIYLLFCFTGVIVLFTEGKFGNLKTFDFVIVKIEMGLMILLFLSPYIFLSNTRFKKKIPLFKNNNSFLSFVGMIIVVISFVVLINAIHSIHTDEYLADEENHQYVEITCKDATCEEKGEIVYRCEYCGYKKSESIPIVEHSMVEVLSEKNTITYKCEKCGKEDTMSLDSKGFYTDTIAYELGEKENPYVLTVDDLVNQINTDINAAKNKYNGKWVRITGEIVSHYSAAGMEGYYLYGDRGETGLRIMCWSFDKNINLTMIGKTRTFLGQMREVTIVNVTEIVDCVLVDD